MKTYQITFSPLAKEGLDKLKRSEPTCFQKAMRLLNEIVVHPKTGTGTSGTFEGHTYKPVVKADFQETQTGL